MSNIQAASSNISNALGRIATERHAQPAPNKAPNETQSSARQADSLELSQGALDASALSPRVETVRTEIAAGNYDTDAKLDAALDAMFDSLGL